MADLAAPRQTGYGEDLRSCSPRRASQGVSVENIILVKSPAPTFGGLRRVFWSVSPPLEPEGRHSGRPA